MYLQLSFQLALPGPLPTRFFWGALGKSQPGHELDGKEKGWREKKGGVWRDERGRMWELKRRLGVCPVLIGSNTIAVVFFFVFFLQP